jgi:hypothetical protein
MSAEMYDGESAGALALPAVDILPAKVARKTKGTPEVAPQAEPLLEASPQGWAAPAPHAPVNPWSDAPAQAPAGAPTEATLASFPPPAAAAPAAAPAAAAPTLVPLPVQPVQPTAEVPAPATADAPKKFFGMQVRRPKKPVEAEPVDDALAVTPPPFAGHEILDPDAPVQEVRSATYEAVVAPVAAWPTDVGVSAVADAEPTQAAGGYSAPAQFAPIDLLAAPPVEAATAAPASAEVTAEAVAVEAAPLAPTPVVEAPTAPSADAAEAAALRAQLGVSESARLAAENRADQAVAYAQQTQARLQQLESDGQARIQAAESKARSAANEAQDWQIRHREAEATIAELAASLAGAELRMSELASQRDELLASLDAATAPDHSEDHATTS